MRYEFTYTTPTPGTDENGDPITIDVPTTFALGGISLDVAKGIRFGLTKCQQLGLIGNVDAEVFTESNQTVTGNPGA